MYVIMREMNDIFRCFAQFRTERVAPLGLKSIHCGYITEVCEHPGVSQDSLSKRTYINKSNVARQLAFLEENGFVLRKPSDKDKRILQVFPTEKAYEALPVIQRAQEEWEQQLTEGFTDEQKEALRAQLADIKARAVRCLEAL